MTWLTDISTVTIFSRIGDVKRLHGHEGKTEVVIENVRKDRKKFEMCREMAKLKKDIKDHKKGVDGGRKRR
jgi:6-pyruvoyl-tetrahydropterin synthase